ncbi:FHA domain-containing protein [Streptomyces sp. NPDC005962]|uniref:FHA domain-containing protein n=1 Tax=Streptomyces sp. NPDC005962 TaxID=3154466 RepID=UPI0033F20846
MPTCPNGHQSAADDWCEVCGHRMSGTPMPSGHVPPPPPPPMPGGGYGAPAPGGPPPPPGGGYGYPSPPAPPQPDIGYQQPELCPQCRTPREAQAPYCEECRFNFLTQQPTSYAPPPPGQGGFPPPPGPPQPYGQQQGPPSYGQPPHPQQHQPPHQTHGGDYQASRPSQINRPAEPLSPSDPNQPSRPAFGAAEDDWPLPPPQASAGAAASPPPAPAPPQQQGYGYGYPQAPQPPAPAAPSFGNEAYPGHGAPPPPGPYGQGGGHTPPPPAGPANWVAVVAPDRDYFTAMMHRSGPEAAGLNLPAYSPEQQLQLGGRQQITIGRRRHSTGEAPDIDLGRAPEDPGVSHQHAVLVQQPDGGWAVVDQDSTNGTTINGGEEPIQPYVPIPLQDGDRVHVGAWTTITVRRG